MSGTPKFKVYRPAEGRKMEYIAACKYCEDAAMLASNIGDGAQIRYQHDLIVWTVGKDEPAAAYDYIAKVAAERIRHAYSTTLSPIAQ